MAHIVFQGEGHGSERSIFGEPDGRDLFQVGLVVHKDRYLEGLLLIVTSVRVEGQLLLVALGPDGAASEPVVLVGLRDEGLHVPDLEHVGLVRGLVRLVKDAVSAESDNLLELDLLVEGLVDVECLMVLGVSFLNLKILGSIQVTVRLALSRRFRAEEEKEHVNLNHAEHLDVLNGNCRLLNFACSTCLALGHIFILEEVDTL
mgnify:CR=1 FL=1